MPLRNDFFIRILIGADKMQILGKEEMLHIRGDAIANVRAAD